MDDDLVQILWALGFTTAVVVGNRMQKGSPEYQRVYNDCRVLGFSRRDCKMRTDELEHERLL